MRRPAPRTANAPKHWSEDAQALRRVALVAARPAGLTLLGEIVAETAASLGMAAAFIGIYSNEQRTRMRTLGAVLDGTPLRDFEYPLAGSPCAKVVGTEFLHVERGLASEFQPGTIFAAKGMDSYAAYPLCDRHGTQLGLIAALDRAPLRDAALAEVVLKIAGSRVAAELERAAFDAVLRSAAIAVSKARGVSVFAELVRYLATILRVELAYIARLDDGPPATLEVMAAQLDGNPLDAIRYEVAGTPCESVLDSGFQAFESGIGERFVSDETLAKLGMVSYAGHALVDLAGKPIGLISIASRQPLRHQDRLESMLQIFAVRAGAELERLRAEQALRASEESYRTIFEASEDCIVIHDWHTGAVVDLNPKACEMTGYRRESVIGQSLEALSWGEPPYSKDDAVAQIERARRGERPRFEWRRRNRHGNVRFDEVRLKSVSIGGVPRILSFSRDITDMKHAEEALRLREEQYRAIFEASSDAFLLRDADLNVVDVNPAFLKLYGFTREQLAVPGGYPSSFPPAYVDERRERLLRALAGEETRIETVALRPDGTSFEADLRVIPVRYRGRAHVLTVARDVTERRTRDRELQRSEARLRATVEAAFDCIIGMDGAGRIVEFNKAAERVFGHPREEVIGRLLADVIIPQRHRSGHSDGLAKFARTGVGPYIGRLVETTAMRADGSEFPVELAISVAAAPDGNIYVGHLRDISARREAEARRAELEGQLRQAQKMEAIGQLTGGIAHDFNNILTSITGYVVLAGERAERIGDATIARQLDQAHIAAQRARDLISQMLAFARRQRSERRPTRLADALPQSAQLLRSTLPSSISLATSFDPATPPVLADPIQIEQVLFNLCINARDAIVDAGSIRIDLAVGAHAGTCASCRAPVRGNWATLTVTDTGSGIDATVRARMFEPFFTTKPVGRGSGMGLAMVHGIVHDHAGHLLVDSPDGEGTVFRVLLPVAASGEVAVSGAPASVQAPSQLAGTILLVEDEAMVGAFMTELLGGWGLAVVRASDGIDAERRLADGETRIDVVLTDQTMPGMTGLALAARSRELRPDVPVLLYTGFGEGLDEADVARSGVRAVLRKPVDRVVLHAALSRALAPADA